jgi:hypothetical protein
MDEELSKQILQKFLNGQSFTPSSQNQSVSEPVASVLKPKKVSLRGGKITPIGGDKKRPTSRTNSKQRGAMLMNSPQAKIKRLTEMGSNEKPEMVHKATVLKNIPRPTKANRATDHMKTQFSVDLSTKTA